MNQSSFTDRTITAQPATAAGLTFNVSFDDPTRKYAPYYAAIKSNIVAAGLSWNKYIKGKGSLEIAIKFSATGDTVASSRSVTPSFVRNNGKLEIYEQGAITELRTGIDPNGAAPDIEFNINPSDLTTTLWFDPNPSARTAPVPANKIDAFSVFLHEFGHAIVFNGGKSDTNGTLPGNYQSTFDEKTSFDGTNFFFTGTRATGVYGAPVPLKFGNITHLGNNSPRPGSDLLGDLMNPSVIPGKRLDISALDLAILADTGVPIDSTRNDFNNDQKADILWRNNDGRVALWQMNGSTVSIGSIFATATADWKIAGTGDFNGDRKADILWRNNDGRVTLWTMNGATKVSDTLIAKISTDSKIVGTGDFNGDDQSDILWRSENGNVVLWQMDGATRLATDVVANVSADWKIVGTGDFNGDNKSDLLWRNDDGTVVLWQMDGTNVLSRNYLNPTSKVDNSWKISGLGDFNADSKSDILWRNDNGDVDMWLMDGPNIRTASFVRSIDNSWKIAGTGDFSGDGQDDILWRKDTGSTSLWEMNGTNILASSAISPNPLISTDWKVAAPIL
jgi:FG-GAP-like repeat